MEGTLAVLMQHVPELALAAALAWGAGIRLYLVVFIFGLASWLGYWELHEHLAVLAHPLVLFASGFMTVVELLADKLPFLDTAWDAVHTFIRIPAGAVLAAQAIGDVSPSAEIAAALLGGTLAAGTHFAKAGTRLLINASPEPFSNWTASFVEDATVIAGVWAAVAHPWVFLVALVLFVALVVWALPKIWRGMRALARAVGRLLRGRRPEPEVPAAPI